MRRTIVRFLAALVLVVCAPSANASGPLAGPLPLTIEPSAPLSWPANGELQIAGIIGGQSPVTLVVRIDDAITTDYSSRKNDEHVLPPGPFTLTYDLARLEATNGRYLNPAAVTRIVVFPKAEGTGSITAITIAPKRDAAAAGNPLAAAIDPRGAAPADTKPAARGFGTGRLPIAFEPLQPIALVPGHVVKLEGRVPGPAAATVVLRIDDDKSTGYTSRVNLEERVKAGPFALKIDVSNLRTNDGRLLNPAAITRVIAFVDGSGEAIATRFDVTASGAAPIAGPATPAPGAKAAGTPIGPQNFGAGALPIKFDPPNPVAFDDADEIRIEGSVNSTKPAPIAVRIDDTQSTSYATRYNDERIVPPGPFKLRIGLKGLKTPSGRIVDHSAVTRIHLFPWQGNVDVTITRFETGRGATLPLGARGYALGADNAPLHPGFERIAPDDGRIKVRGTLQTIRRPAPDPLVANGLRGVERLTLDSAKGRVRVTLWSEDPGEWEDLPRELDRNIRVNGKDALAIKRTADAWITERYLRGRNSEHTANDDAWTAYGKLRGNRRSIDVDAPDGRVTIELTGSDPSAYFLSAVLVEPAPIKQTETDAPGQALIEAQRAEWYRSTFPVAAHNQRVNDGGILVSLGWSKASAPTQPIRQRAAPDTGIALRLDVISDQSIATPSITLEPPRRGNAALPTTIWAAENRLERDGSVLKLTDNRLIADLSARPLDANATRSYDLWVDVPSGTPPGIYEGAVTFARGAEKRRQSIEVTVLPVALPKVTKPAGFYLARTPHLTYFNGLAIERDRQLDCDLDLFRRFGLSNTVPPIGGLDRTDLSAFATDMRRPLSAGVAAGWLVYNPLFELQRQFGNERAATVVARLESVIKASNLPAPLWSIADEPSNPDQHAGDLAAWAAALRRASPGIKLAGHLNNPDDEKFAHLFDTIIVNDGFGIDATHIARHVKSGRKVWFYNTFAHRLTAGLWLWSTAAERYVQWHARMPTADPFDPLDGREADFQMLYPAAAVCPPTPDIHRDLLRLAEGVVDQRWLLWLEQQSKPAAQALVREIRTLLATPFEQAKQLSRTDLEALRGRIMDIAASK